MYHKYIYPTYIYYIVYESLNHTQSICLCRVAMYCCQREHILSQREHILSYTDHVLLKRTHSIIQSICYVEPPCTAAKENTFFHKENTFYHTEYMLCRAATYWLLRICGLKAYAMVICIGSGLKAYAMVICIGNYHLLAQSLCTDNLWSKGIWNGFLHMKLLFTGDHKFSA